MKYLLGLNGNQLLGRLLVLAWIVSGVEVSSGAPVIISTTPANMAAGVPVTAPIIFTFGEAMNPSVTAAQVMDAAAATFLATTPSWAAGNTVLTCTPVQPLPANKLISWSVTGKNPGGTSLGGTRSGFFITASAGIGCDSNAPGPSFTVSKGWMYSQTSAGAPAQNLDAPYCFLACMTLPCPRDATNVTVQTPNGSVSDMNPSPLPGHLTLPDCSFADLAAYEAFYPYGNYIFIIQAFSSNQQVTVNFPTSLTQPPAPHITNYLAAQSIDPALPFVLGWDAFTGGTAADCIYVEIYGDVFKTPGPGEGGALNGTARSVTIPAGTFEPNRQYSGCVSFYHFLLQTNANSHVSLSYRCSTTEFDLRTGSSLMLTNAGWAAAGVFSFEVLCTTGQVLIAQCSTNPLPEFWQSFYATNPVSQRVRILDPRAVTNKTMFYRVRTGP